MCGLILVALVCSAASTKRFTSDEVIRVGSLLEHDRHICNAVQIESGFYVTPAACLSTRDPAELELLGKELSPKVTSKTRCNVTKVQTHPKYLFLSHNIALLQVECDHSLGEFQGTSLSDSKPGERLTLAGVNRSLRSVFAHVKTQECSVCQKEYAVFNCKRQMCLKASGKVSLNVAEGLAGAGIFTQQKKNAKLTGVLSYGFANGSLVAERMIYYAQFLQRTMQEFKSGKSNSPSSKV
uniref:Peptidase S1 domain-containing protein n=1 Tax=Anopheles culicifacies TaxID=139723 RepID=A0A182MNR7_9DIPT